MKYKIVLAALNKNTVYTPLALLYCKACIGQDAVLRSMAEAELSEFELSDGDDYIAWRIAGSSPDIVGFSCYLWNIEKISRLCAVLKKVLPSVKIVLGGPEVSPMAEDVLRECVYADAVIRGEGEFAFIEAVKALLNISGSMSGIKGLTYRGARGVISNPERALIRELDSIPSVYIDGKFDVSNREVCLETQRGCVFGCGFCYYNKGARGWRRFGMDRVKKELGSLLSRRNATIYLMDPVFNIDLGRAKEICGFIIARNRFGTPFHTEIQAELVDAELASLLKKAEMRYVEVGLQSDNEQVLKKIGRPYDRERFLEGYGHLKKVGLVIELQLILGLPGEDLASFERSLEFALKLDPAALSVFKLQVLPGTVIRKRARDFGIEFENKPPYEFIQSPEMPFADFITAQKIVNSVSFFRKNRTALAYCKRTGRAMTSLIREWLDHMPDDGILLNGEDNAALKREAGVFIRSLRARKAGTR